MKIFFISHIGEEAALALMLQEWLESTFGGRCRVFVSASPRDLSPGTSWLDEIRNALEDAAALFLLCSSSSIRRPWINFEAGCGWIRGVPVIPICHSGVSPGDLPQPLGSLQALDTSSPKFCEELLEAARKYLEFEQLPRLDLAAMKEELREAIGQMNAERVASTAVVGSTTSPLGELDVLGISGSDLLELEDFGAKIVKATATRTTYSWRIRVRNTSQRRTGFSARVSLQDKDGFKIDDRLCIFEARIGPGKTGELSESLSLRKEDAANVGRIHAAVSTHNLQRQ